MTDALTQDLPVPLSEPFRVGDWLADPRANTLARGTVVDSVEPKVMDLLALFCAAPGRIFTREELDRALWPNVVVGEDSLSRAISRLRRSLGDDAGSPRYIETISKRGYRLIASVGGYDEDFVSLGPAKNSDILRWLIPSVMTVLAIALLAFLVRPGPVYPPPSPVGQLTERADDLYMQFTRADNEAAIELYERALDIDPENASAQSGLANALVQRVIRWQMPPGMAPEADSLTEALSSGVTSRAEARALIDRAVDLGERAVRLSPHNADALKALGFAYSARGDLASASEFYLRAIEEDPDAWDVMANLGELALMRDDNDSAVHWLTRAHGAMETRYSQEPQRIGAWLAPLGVLIGDLEAQMGNNAEAESWYRRVLDQTPLEPEATVRLVSLLRARGESGEADRLCNALAERVGQEERCRAVERAD